ncbi:MAG TPA: ABC transporter substrate-binding protein [Acidocella sp.]|nr:ABC transporter substrate-binding protein [Acidocella sp.]
MILSSIGLAARADTPESMPVQALDAALLATMKAGSANASFQSRYDALDPVVKASMNLPVILQNSVGFLWSTLPAEQQSELAIVFEQYTVASYINGFSGYGGQKLELLPDERDVGTKKIVETQIVSPDGTAPVRLDYVLTNGDNGWQITDVLENATISQVATQSSDFSALVSSGDASKLIAALKAKVATLSGGVLKD